MNGTYKGRKDEQNIYKFVFCRRLLRWLDRSDVDFENLFFMFVNNLHILNVVTTERDVLHSTENKEHNETQPKYSIVHCTCRLCIVVMYIYLVYLIAH